EKQDGRCCDGGLDYFAAIEPQRQPEIVQQASSRVHVASKVPTDVRHVGRQERPDRASQPEPVLQIPGRRDQRGRDGEGSQNPRGVREPASAYAETLQRDGKRKAAKGQQAEVLA